MVPRVDGLYGISDWLTGILAKFVTVMGEAEPLILFDAGDAAVQCPAPKLGNGDVTLITAMLKRKVAISFFGFLIVVLELKGVIFMIFSKWLFVYP
mgnify:CR=1 FL=1